MPESPPATASNQSGLRHRRYGEYTTADRAELAVRVTAADFNGTSWDGCPFSVIPDWLRNALRDESVAPHTKGSTDYAQWHVMTAKGIVNATPGDWIIRRERGDLSVVEEADAFILINLREPVNGREAHDAES